MLSQSHLTIFEIPHNLQFPLGMWQTNAPGPMSEPHWSHCGRGEINVHNPNQRWIIEYLNRNNF